MEEDHRLDGTVVVLSTSPILPPPQVPVLNEETINHPKHYNSHPAGIECIDVVEHLPFNIGNSIKYLWRAGLKGDAIEDLRKAIWYIEREIQRLGKANELQCKNPG